MEDLFHFLEVLRADPDDGTMPFGVHADGLEVQARSRWV